MPETVVSSPVVAAPLWPRGTDGLPVAEGIGAGDARGPLVPVEDPATRQSIGWCRLSPAEAVTDAVSGAVDAFTRWAAGESALRADALRRAADAVASEVDVLAACLTSEVGKPLHESRGDVLGGASLLRMFADLAAAVDEIDDLTAAPGAGAADEVIVHRVPVGPVVVITPWNTPVYLTMNCVAPALAAGCTVVVKPAEEAPLAVTAALSLLAAELPPGVLSVVQGTGVEVGSALCRDPRVRGVFFVGGSAAGREVIRAASDSVKKLSLELGGNDAALVLEDAAIDEDMLREMIAGCFALSGQVCFSIKRIYVHRSRYDEFVSAFTRLVDALVVGRGSTPAVQVGPLTTEGGYRNALRLLHAARDEGAHVHEGGRLEPGLDLSTGRFVRPTVVTGIRPDHELVLEEQFAPIIPVLAFDDDDEALREANRTEYGLCSSVWSADADHARAVALRVEAGNTFVNAHRVGASVPAVPFGGFKQSGLGRNHLRHAIAECTEEHAVIRYTDASRQIPGIDHWHDITLEEGE